MDKRKLKVTLKLFFKREEMKRWLLSFSGFCFKSLMASQSGLFCLFSIPWELPEGILPTGEEHGEQFCTEKQLSGDRGEGKLTGFSVYGTQLSGTEFETWNHAITTNALCSFLLG